MLKTGHPTMKLFISNCVFRKDSFLTLWYGHNIAISNTIFDGSSVGANGVTVFLLVNNSFTGSSFPLAITSSDIIAIRDSEFTNNIDISMHVSDSRKIDIDNTNFTNNNSSTSGGAIYSQNSTIRISNCLFSGNKAFFHAGTIYNSGQMFIINSVLNGSPATDNFDGNVIYSTVYLRLLNVTINAATGTSSSAVLIYTNFGNYFDEGSIYKLHCPTNSNVKTKSNEGLHFSPQFKANLYCIPCRKGTYSLDGGQNDVYYNHSNSIFHPQYIKCLPCPTGGICEKGIISKDNYYGYRHYNGKLEFIICMPYYCCSSKGSNKCTSYNTCARNRAGLLCGVCKKGYSENIASTECIPDHHCNSNVTIVFAVGYVVFALVFTFSWMYIKEIGVLAKRVVKYHTKYNRNSLQNTESGNNEDHIIDQPRNDPNNKDVYCTGRNAVLLLPSILSCQSEFICKESIHVKFIKHRYVANQYL